MRTLPARLAALLVPVLVTVVACTPPPSGGGGTTTTTSTTTSTTTTTTSTTVPAHVMSVGHADVLEVTRSGNALVLQIKDDTTSPSTLRNPAATILRAKPGAAPQGSQLSVPSSPAFSFLGAPGAPTWILPEVQNTNLLWPGISTERIAAGVLQGNQVQLRLDAVTGPGTFHLYNVDAFGQPVVRFASTGSLPQTLTVGTTTHAHYSWAFSAAGTYTLTFRATATLANGTPVTSGPVPYTFRVGVN